jgi:adenosylcobyric acid synthase
MVLGTASHVGKSVLTAALGRILSDDGFCVAPFKAQNMSLSSAATPDGREIGRAQALQAEACRAVAKAEMNPVLIKPSTGASAQVMLLGRVWGQVDASDYYRRRVEELFPSVLDSFHALAAENDIVLLEGAGSPAEINLKSRDIVNMRMALAAEAPCLLVGDIDRGGVFASLLGTLELLDPAERACIRAFIINKFRGDVSLLMPGIRMIEDRIGIPCAGVVPYLEALGLDEEDSVVLESRSGVNSWKASTSDARECRCLRMGVIAFPHLSNFTDFDALTAEPSIALAYIHKPEDLDMVDVLVFPGTKQTLDDLMWLRSTGLAAAIDLWRAAYAQKRLLVGICGGMQILGLKIEDVDGTEGGTPMIADGLGYLPICTALRSAKVTRCATGVLSTTLLGSVASGTPIQGYEIHLGETTYLPNAEPFARILRAGDKETVLDGAVDVSGNVWGSYLHGLFDEDEFRHTFVRAARERCGLAPPLAYARVHAEREERIDRLAGEVRRALDMNLVYRLLGVDQSAGVSGTLAHYVV